jgi:hypothetical protein
MAELASVVADPTRIEHRVSEEMFALYARYYGGANPDQFARDLDGKTHVLLMRDDAGYLQGFSTLALSTHRVAGEDIRVVFSGDTIVDHRWWARHDLAFAWLRLAGSFKADAPDRRLYWLLIVKGHRTYRYLPVFARDYHPAHDRETPAAMRRLADVLARRFFGADYDAASGLLRYPPSRGYLAPDWCEPPLKDAARPEVRFFLDRNPGYAQGHELVCLCELSPGNLKPLARRIFVDGMASGNADAHADQSLQQF